MHYWKLTIPDEIQRNLIPIGLCIGVSILALSLLFLVAFSQPKPVVPAYRPVPTVTPVDYYYYLEQPELYYAGKCLIVSKDAAPELYALHPGIEQCRFKTVAP